MAEEGIVNPASYDDATIIMLLLDGTLARNRHFDFFSTERGRTVHRQAKILEGVLHDLKNGAKIISEVALPGEWRVVLENKENHYRRTVIMTETMHKIFRALRKKVMKETMR